MLRGVLAVLALVISILAGLPQDRFPPGRQDGGPRMAAHATSGHSHATTIASAATADPDDGFDDAVRMVVPQAGARRPAVRIRAAVRRPGENAAPILLERPPRIAA